MKAIILAAGRSKRLRPLTNNQPKCLLKIGTTRIIDLQIKTLLENGIKEIIMVVGFKSEVLKKYLLKKYGNCKFYFIRNPIYQKTNAAYSLWLAKKFLKDTIIYLNSDVICDKKIITLIIKTKLESATAIQRVPWDEEEVNVIINKKNQIIELGKHITKKTNHGEFIGVTKLGKKLNLELVKALNDCVKKNELKKFAADAINLAIQKGGLIHSLDVTKLKAMEIDTIQDYNRAQKMWHKNEKFF